MCDVAVRFPTNTRSIRLREIASFSVSTSPIRTVTEKVSSSRIMTSAAVAPLSLRAVDDVLARCSCRFEPALIHFSVPPTVISRILIVGRPTLTGIVWPSLPQMPTP